ncbi:MAG: DUF4349 domain-containing protein [Actinomycetota bacterium]|nr:DUF4349 domain-containing protein [Actinomycetota bacterium]
MAKTRWTSRTGPGAAGALLLLVLFLQGCGGGGGSQAGVGDAAPGPSMEEAAGGAEMAVVQESGMVTEQVFDRMVVKTADLGIRSEDVRGSAEEARLVAGRFGGEVLSSRVYAGSGPVSAELVLSVPSGEFEAALDELRGLGNRVTTDTVEGQDVTEEFVDLESRERNLLAAEESLLTLYDRAESVEGTLTVERELTDIRGQIEEAQGRIQYLERRTATSEIILHLEPVVTAPPQQTWSPSAVAARAWDASLGVLQAAATAFISAVVFCWWLLPPLAVGLLLWRRGRVTSTSG